MSDAPADPAFLRAGGEDAAHPRFAEPLKPSAVLLPPALLLGASVFTTLAAHRLLMGVDEPVPLWRAALLAAVLMAAACILRFGIRTRGSLFAVFTGAALGAAMVVAAQALLIPPALHPAAVFVAALCGGLSPPLWRGWRHRWTRTRDEHVTVLAPSEAQAFDAARRLEAVPWVRVTSVLVPGGKPRSVASLLWPPKPDADPTERKIERRVVVSCPVRTPAVGREIAQLVSHGHEITSESATLRMAEGRVDTALADPLTLLMSLPRSRGMETSSRVMDVLLSLTLLVVFLPVFLVIALAIVLESGFPVFYRQRRVGSGGRTFDVVKFRSMRKDAEAQSGPVWARGEDPRITRVGRFLRRYHLDELPQLWNVLRGSMALVGPRPERPHFFEILREDVPLFDLRTIVRPGLTGWAQIRLLYAENADDARKKLEFDLFYVTRRSPWFDLAILFETLRVVLLRQGNHRGDQRLA